MNLKKRIKSKYIPLYLIQEYHILICFTFCHQISSMALRFSDVSFCKRERLENELIFYSLDFCVGVYIMVSSLESGGSVSKSWVKLVIQWAIWSNLDPGDLGQDPQFGKIHRKLESCSSPWARLIIDPFHGPNFVASWCQKMLVWSRRL